MTTKLYCPMCGAPMTVDALLTMPRSGKTYQQITCDTLGCEAYRCTTSDVSVLNGSFAAAWHFHPRFDAVTCADLLQREIEGLRSACKLVLIVISQDSMCAAFNEDTAVLDPYTLVSVLRDWWSILRDVETAKV